MFDFRNIFFVFCKASTDTMSQFQYMMVDYYMVATDNNGRFYLFSSYDSPLILLNDYIIPTLPAMVWNNITEYNLYIRGYLSYITKLPGVVGRVNIPNYDTKTMVSV